MQGLDRAPYHGAAGGKRASLYRPGSSGKRPPPLSEPSRVSVRVLVRCHNRHRLCPCSGMKMIWAGMVAVGLLASCQQVQGWLGSKEGTDSTQSVSTAEAHGAMLQRDAGITRENAYSDLFLDSAALEAYIGAEKIAADKAERMRTFYAVRNNQFAWFTSAGATEQARGLWGLYESKAEELKEKAPERLQQRMDSLLTRDSAARTPGAGTVQASRRSSLAAARTGRIASEDSARLADSTAALAGISADSMMVQTELALTAQFVRLVGESGGGFSADNFYWMVPRRKLDALTLADSILNRGGDSLLGQGNAQYAALKAALPPYYEAARAGGWPSLSGAAGLKKGLRAPAVTQLKKRLAASGDYPAGDTSTLFSDTLLAAVRTVQAQYGLLPTGVPSDSLLRELNVPAQERLQQILVNMNRALWIPAPAGSRHISINVPSQELLAYGDSGAVMRMPVIVGREGASTMAFNDRISTVVFNPYWNIPESIVERKILPAMEQDPRYLAKHHMEIVKQDDSIPQVRQLPGPDNALGRVKFLFPNTFDIYLHDTPEKGLFVQKNRALSNGCVRVAKPDSLAAYVLRGQPGWTPEKIAAAMKGNGKEEQVKVKEPVPVSITYYTAWAGADGKLQFRRDLYGYDARTIGRMFTAS
ncbi:MAG: hypothetical protein EOO11_04580 [Chitinophagaceae bacterium]|nr:MAG: hypothetical protein EOO11_04580 [Chitinophagaceae bacterium]